MLSTKSKYRYSCRDPHALPTPFPASAPTAHSFTRGDTEADSAGLSAVCSASWGKAGNKQPWKCATSVKTEGHRGCGGAKQGPLIQLRGSEPAYQTRGHLAEPWDKRLAWVAFLADEATVDLCPGGAPPLQVPAPPNLLKPPPLLSSGPRCREED